MNTPDERIDTYKDGGVKARGFELDGQLHGNWKWYRQDGTLLRSGEFDQGVQVGKWCTYTREGVLHKETHFTK